MISFFSNNCLAYYIYMRLNMKYTNPLIGSLFLDENHFVKLISNIDYYFGLEPVFGVPKLEDSKYYLLNESVYYKYKHPNYTRTTYPIMILDDIHIHWIHEFDEKELIDKWKRRIERYYSTQNKSNIVLLSYRDCFCNKEDFEKILRKLDELKVDCFLFGPSKFQSILKNTKIRLIIDKQDRDKFPRKSYLHFKNHDLNLAINEVYKFIKKR